MKGRIGEEEPNMDRNTDTPVTQSMYSADAT